MTDALKILLDEARKVQMSPEDMEEQRVSFAYGNTKIENDHITRETVKRESEALKSEARPAQYV